MSNLPISDGFQLRCDGVPPAQWPKLSCSEANQTALQDSDLRLDANRKILFQGNGQIKSVGDIHILTGETPPSEKLSLLANGNLGIGTTTPTEKLEVAGKIKATQLEASGAVKAATFQGDGSALTGKVSTTGDTMTGPLTIQNTLSVSSSVGIGTTTAPRGKLDVAGDVYVEGNLQLKGENLAAMLLRKRHYHGIVDVDSNMPLVLHLCFESQLHIPKTIKLFLRGFQFSRAFYTELGRHTHQADSQSINLQHAHGHNFYLSTNGDHDHAIHVGNTGGAGKPGDHRYAGAYPESLGAWQQGWASLVTCFTPDAADYWVSRAGNHSHSVNGGIQPSLGEHKHAITVNPAGGAVSAGGEVKEYLNSLQLVVNGQRRTDSWLKRLSGWNEMGNGTAGHPLVTGGTGVLDITDLVPLTVGTHEVRFEVANGGGKLLYNVFCE